MKILKKFNYISHLASEAYGYLMGLDAAGKWCFALGLDAAIRLSFIPLRF